MCDQSLVTSWIQEVVSSFHLGPMRYTAKPSTQVSCSSAVYKWPLESGRGVIRLYYDCDNLMAVFSVAFKKAFSHFSLPELDGAPYTVLYFDKAVSCFLDNADSIRTPPDFNFSLNTSDGPLVISPHMFYLKTDGQFGAMHCLDGAATSGIILLTKDKDLVPPFHYPGICICPSKNHYALKALITDLLHYPYENKAAEFFFKGKIQEFLSYLISDQESPSDAGKDTLSSGRARKSEEENIQRVMEYIRSHPDVNLSGQEIVREARMSLAKLKYCFKDLTGMTMTEYKTDVQIKKACQLLWESDLTIAEIAHICGYQNTTSFDAFFKKEVGLSPLQYRKKA